jgi:DNA-binding MarR family transcriptional regulator
MIKAVATAVETAERAAGQAPVQSLYLEALTLVERLHRRLLDVIKDEFDRRGRADINSVQALLLYNIGDKELTAGELRTRGYYLGSNVSYNLKKLVELGFLDHQRSRVDRRSVRIRLTAQGQEIRRGIRDPEQVAAPARAVLDRPDPVSALRFSRPRQTAKPALKRPAAHQKDNFPKRIGPVSGPVRFVVRPALAERRAPGRHHMATSLRRLRRFGPGDCLSPHLEPIVLLPSCYRRPKLGGHHDTCEDQLGERGGHHTHQLGGFGSRKSKHGPDHST